MSGQSAIDLLAMHPALLSAGQLETREHRGVQATGVRGLDRLIGGGWPRGVLSELTGPRSSGRTAVLQASLATAIARGETVALIDPAGAFDPRTAVRAGIPLERLLWVRGGSRALAATELLMNAGGFGLVVLDLDETPVRAPTAAWVRLKQVAERQGTALLLIAARRAQGVGGGVVITLHRSGAQFQDTSPLPAAPAALRVLGTRAVLERMRGQTGNDNAPATLELQHDLAS